MDIIGVSLSEPHTCELAGATSEYVCTYVGRYGMTYTYHYKVMFLAND